MSALSDIVPVTITAASNRTSQQGFGVPLILSHSASWVERVRSYNQLSDVGADFATTTPEYKAANAVFAQTPRPPVLKIGRVSGAPVTQRFAVYPTAVNNKSYTLEIDGQTVTFVADGTATVTEIIAGLKGLIDALGLAVTVSDQTTYMRVIANAANAWHSMGSTDANLIVKQDHADPGIAAEMNNVLQQDSDFYAVISTYNSQLYAMALAGWAQAAKRLYVVQSEDGSIPNTTSSGTDDLGEAVKAQNYDHVAVIYSPSTRDFADAAWLGRNLTYTPGSETWKFKTLAGVTVGAFTPTQRTNMRAKNVNFYEVTNGKAMTEEGYTGSGQYIDATRYVDYLSARIAERVFGAISTPAKVPLNSRGIGVVQSEVRAQLETDEAREALLPGWVVTVPKVSDISSSNRTNRILPDIHFDAVYAGAVHKVPISGTVTF